MALNCKNWTKEELDHYCNTMRRQIGWNSMACVAAHAMIHAEREDGCPQLWIKTRNCGSRNRWVVVTLELGQDLYRVQGVNCRGFGECNGYIVPKPIKNGSIKFEQDQVFFDMLPDSVVEAADQPN